MTCRYCAKSTCEGECRVDVSKPITVTPEEIKTHQLELKLSARDILMGLIGDQSEETQSKVQTLIDTIILCAVLEVASVANEL